MIKVTEVNLSEITLHLKFSESYEWFKDFLDETKFETGRNITKLRSMIQSMVESIDDAQEYIDKPITERIKDKTS